MGRLDDLQIRTMRREELAFAIDLAARESWNPGLDDAECFYSADAGGFLIGELRGEPIGCISAVSYGRAGPATLTPRSDPPPKRRFRRSAISTGKSFPSGAKHSFVAGWRNRTPERTSPRTAAS